MTVYFPDSPGDCPTGMNLSVISCAEGAGGPPPRNTLIPTSATTNLRMVIRSPSSPSFDEERSRLLLLSDSLLRVPPSEEETPDGLVLEPPCLPEVGDGLRVKAAAPQHPDAVVRLASGAGEQSRSLRGGYGAARLQQLDALSDVLEHVDDPQEGGDRHDLRPIELDTLALGVDLRQRLARRRIVERLAVVEADRAFDGLDGIVVEERPGVRRLHQRRNVERAVARRAEPVVRRDPLARQASWLIGQILHTGVEVGIPEAAPTREVGRRPRIHMADIALAEFVVEEDLLPSLGHRALEPQGQREVLLPPQGQLEGLQGVELLTRGQAKVDTRNPVQGLGEMLNHRAGREGPERPVPRRPVARPPGARPTRALHRGPETEGVRHPPHDELVLEIVEAIQIFENQPELAHQRGILEVLLQVRVELGDEQGIVLRERGDECRIDGEVVFRRMAGAAGTPVAGERLVEEQVSPLGDELAQAIGC